MKILKYLRQKLGKLNPLPDLSANQDTHANIAIDEETVSPEESKYMGWAKVNSILPYMIQDGYDRKKSPSNGTPLFSKNDFIKAVFLPSTGRPSLVAVRQKRPAANCCTATPYSSPATWRCAMRGSLGRR